MVDCAETVDAGLRGTTAVQRHHLQCFDQRLREGPQWSTALRPLTQVREERLQSNVIPSQCSDQRLREGPQWSPALRLVAQVREERLQSNGITYSASTSAFEKAHSGDCAETVDADP